MMQGNPLEKRASSGSEKQVPFSGAFFFAERKRCRGKVYMSIAFRNPVPYTVWVLVGN